MRSKSTVALLAEDKKPEPKIRYEEKSLKEREELNHAAEENLKMIERIKAEKKAFKQEIRLKR